MSDNKNFDEEYQYVEEPDIEPIDVNPEDEPMVNETIQSKKSFLENFFTTLQQPSVKRNALFAVLALFILLGLLKCASKPSIKQEFDQPMPVQQQSLNPQTNSTNQSITMSVTQLQELINSQKNMQNNLVTMNDKLNQMNAQFNALSSNHQVLQQEFSQLMNKYQALEQSIHEAIASFKSRPQLTNKPTIAHRRYQAPTPKINYYVEAIIPGRAWLVSSQGKTVTVRVGSVLPGYGRVATIDAQQGRVEMSTSKVFVFSQAD